MRDSLWFGDNVGDVQASLRRSERSLRKTCLTSILNPFAARHSSQIVLNELSLNIFKWWPFLRQDKGIFPLKIREGLILEANNFLRKKGLFPEDDGDDDDECVFGDDDFPS